jgi:hypothetical protein
MRPERFRAKWIPVRAKKTRQNKNPEPRSDSIGTEKSLDHDEFRLRRRDHADLSRKRGEVNQMSTSIQLKTIMHPAVLIVGKSAISVISPIWRVMSGSCRNWK